jgi:acyl dehydratase
MTFPTSLELRCGPITAVDLALYAAASGDLNPLHLDDAVARSAGFAQPVVHGMLTMAYVGRLFTQTFGSRALVTLNTRFIGAALRGDTLMLSAQIRESDDGTAHYSLRVMNQAGNEIVSGSASVRAPTHSVP